MDPLDFNPGDDEDLPLTVHELRLARDGTYNVEIAVFLNNTFQHHRTIRVQKITNDGVQFQHTQYENIGFIARYARETLEVELYRTDTTNCKKRTECFFPLLSHTGYIPFLNDLAQELGARTIVLQDNDRIVLPDTTTFPRWYGYILLGEPLPYAPGYFPAQMEDNGTEFFTRLQAFKPVYDVWDRIEILKWYCPARARDIAALATPLQRQWARSDEGEFVSIYNVLPDPLLKLLLECLKDIFPFTGEWKKPVQSEPPATFPENPLLQRRIVGAYLDRARFLESNAF